MRFTVRVVLVLIALSFAIGCGKNDNFYGGNYGGYPYQQYPQYGQPNYQIPRGYPQQFQPFAPMYNYMPQPQFNQMWNQWQTYAQINQYPIYAFQPFWQEFCPSHCGQVMGPELYDYLSVNVYVGSSCGGYCY